LLACSCVFPYLLAASLPLPLACLSSSTGTSCLPVFLYLLPACLPLPLACLSSSTSCLPVCLCLPLTCFCLSPSAFPCLLHPLCLCVPLDSILPTSVCSISPCLFCLLNASLHASFCLLPASASLHLPFPSSCQPLCLCFLLSTS
jgi:hypothetical protein